MEVRETTVEGLKRELQVIIGANELEVKLSARLDELKNTINLKGFRPGRVPIGHLRKVYGRSVMAEILEQTVDESTRNVLSEREERPAYLPEVTLPEEKEEIEKVLSGDADLAYSLVFEVLPEILITDFTKLELEKPVADIEPEEIEKALSDLAENSIRYEKKDAPAQDGDQITIDFEGTLDGEPFEGGKSEDASVVLGRGQFIPGFEEGLQEAKTGESRDIETTFPDDYPAEHLAGKRASFVVNIKEVAAPILPEINDEFAKTLGFESEKQLREAVEKQIRERYDSASRSRLKRELLDKLNSAHTFELPKTLVDSEFDNIWRQVTSELEKAKKTFEDEDTTEEKAREEYQQISERRVRLGLVLSEIGDKQEIKVTDDEINKALMERIRQFPGQEQQVYEYYKKHPEAMAELRAPVFEDKVVDYILELAKVTENKMNSEDLFKVDDDEAAAA